MGTATDNLPALFTMKLTEEERSQLLNWLQQRLKNKLVEEHRTDAADYRQYVIRQEEIIGRLIDKLRKD